MQILEKLFRKKKKLIVGLMSGTSADGIDAVLAEIVGNGTRTTVRQLAFATYPYPKGYKQFLLKNSDAETARLDDVVRLNMYVAFMFSEAAKNITRRAGKRMKDIDLIGTHGQTICHLPTGKKMFGKNIRASLQIGNPPAIAKLTGIVTVGDFRTGDIAAGGAGAPLVPYFDYLLFRSRNLSRALLNIGGIANLTVLPKQCALGDVVAFDTGPGNMLVDSLVQHYYGKPFDKGGKIAMRGKVVPSLLRWLMNSPYLQVAPPKSTGRELFGQNLAEKILAKTRRERKENVITSVAEFTAMSIYMSYLRFIRKNTMLDELLVSGGGVHNRYVMEALKKYFSGVKVASVESAGIASDAKEAMCFAVLANETIAGNQANVPGATGAARQTTLGTICLP